MWLVKARRREARDQTAPGWPWFVTATGALTKEPRSAVVFTTQDKAVARAMALQAENKAYEFAARETKAAS